MHIPIRCFTCNASIGQHWPSYLQFLTVADGDFDAFCRTHGMPRVCCRRMIITHVDLAEQICQYKYVDRDAGTVQFRCVAKMERTLSCD